MKKEDLLLVFEFLATALKQDVVVEKPKDKPYKFEDYFPVTTKVEPVVENEDKVDIIIDTIPKSPTEIIVNKYNNDVNAIKGLTDETKVLDTDNKTVKVIKTEAVRIKEIMDMINGKVYPYKKKSSVTETELDKALKLHQQNISSLINGLESKLRDSLVTPDQRRQFKKFVQMENFKAYKDLERIGYFLDNPGVNNPYEGKDEEPVQDVIDTETKTTLVGENKIPISNEMLAKSTVPQMIKNIMINSDVPTSVSVKIEDGQVKFKEEYKNGLGAVKRYGFDGKEIKE